MIKIKLVTFVKGDPKAPFSIGVGGGATPFPELFYFTLEWVLSKGGLSLWYDSTWNWTPVIWAIGEHCSPNHLTMCKQMINK